VRRPQLIFRGELWIAVLGPSIEEGIVGIGPTVAAALGAFDAQYTYWPGFQQLIRRARLARRSCRSPKSALKSRGELSGFAWLS